MASTNVVPFSWLVGKFSLLNQIFYIIEHLMHNNSKIHEGICVIITISPSNNLIKMRENEAFQKVTYTILLYSKTTLKDYSH